MRYSLADVSERMFNRPVAIMRDKAEIIIGAMGPRLNIGSLVIEAENRVVPIGQLADRAAAAKAEIDTRPGDRDMVRRDWETGAVLDPYEVWNGVAILKVRGTLMAEGGLDPSSGATSYAGLDFKARTARADENVRGVVLDIDSGGGEVVDLLEFCRHLVDLRSEKPVRAIVRGTAASAAYALASCANDITCASYSLSGSIGAIIAHADFSKQLSQDGISVTLITSAEHKADGSSVLPLGDEIRKRLQAQVDGCAASFIAHVAEARRMSVDAITAQQARFYGGEEALSLGLVDKIMAWDESLKEFADTVNRRQPSAGSNAPRGTAAGAHRGTANMADDLAPTAEQSDFTLATQQQAVSAAIDSERARIAALAELDGDSTLSAGLTAAIGAGTSAGEFAIGLARAARAEGGNALAGARADAAQGGDLPAPRNDGGGTGPVNRGQAAVDRLAGKHKGLPSRG